MPPRWAGAMGSFSGRGDGPPVGGEQGDGVGDGVAGGTVGQLGEGGAGGRHVVGRRGHHPAVGGFQLRDGVAQAVGQQSHGFKVQRVTGARLRPAPILPPHG